MMLTIEISFTNHVRHELVYIKPTSYGQCHSSEEQNIWVTMLGNEYIFSIDKKLCTPTFIFMSNIIVSLSRNFMLYIDKKKSSTF